MAGSDHTAAFAGAHRADRQDEREDDWEVTIDAAMAHPGARALGWGLRSPPPVSRPRRRRRRPDRPRSAFAPRGGGSSIGGKRNSGPRCDARELLEQLGGAALLDRRSAMDDRVLPQAGRADPRALERDSHPRVAPDVLELSLPQV